MSSLCKMLVAQSINVSKQTRTLSLIVDVNNHNTEVSLWIQVCIWIYLWINDNSVVEFIGESFIAGQLYNQRLILLICFTLTCELQNEFFHLRIIHCYMHRHFLTMSPPPPFFFSCVFYGCTRLLDIWRKVRLLHFVYEIIPLRSLFHCNSWLLWVTFFIYLWNTLNVSRLFFMLRRFPIESKGRRKKLNEV